MQEFISRDEWMEHQRLLAKNVLESKQYKKKEYGQKLGDGKSVDAIEMEELELVFIRDKRRKAPESDGVCVELSKYASPKITERFVNLLLNNVGPNTECQKSGN